MRAGFRFDEVQDLIPILDPARDDPHRAAIEDELDAPQVLTVAPGFHGHDMIDALEFTPMESTLVTARDAG